MNMHSRSDGTTISGLPGSRAEYSLYRSPCAQSAFRNSVSGVVSFDLTCLIMVEMVSSDLFPACKFILVTFGNPVKEYRRLVRRKQEISNQVHIYEMFGNAQRSFLYIRYRLFTVPPISLSS